MTLPVVVPADAELAVVTVLRARIAASADPAAAGVTVGTRVPAGALPSKFVFVRRVGGTLTNVVQDRARIDIMVQHTDDPARMRLANLCRAWLFASRGTNGVQQVTEFMGPARLPDPADDTRQIIMLTVEMTVRAT